MPSTPGSLNELLKSLFTLDELLLFLGQNYPKVRDAIPPGSLDNTAFAAAESLIKRGEVNDSLFARLVQTRPARRFDIEAVRYAGADTLTQTGEWTVSLDKSLGAWCNDGAGDSHRAVAPRRQRPTALDLCRTSDRSAQGLGVGSDRCPVRKLREL